MDILIFFREKNLHSRPCWLQKKTLIVLHAHWTSTSFYYSRKFLSFVNLRWQVNEFFFNFFFNFVIFLILLKIKNISIHQKVILAQSLYKTILDFWGSMYGLDSRAFFSKTAVCFFVTVLPCDSAPLWQCSRWGRTWLQHSLLLCSQHYVCQYCSKLTRGRWWQWRG